jgi:hypothetical protein
MIFQQPVDNESRHSRGELLPQQGHDLSLSQRRQDEEVQKHTQAGIFEF